MMSTISIKNAPGDQILAPYVAWFLYDGYFIENYTEYYTATEWVKACDVLWPVEK